MYQFSRRTASGRRVGRRHACRFIASRSAQIGAAAKPGGTLEIGTVYVTLSALSWDPADWNWKHNHDTGQVYEQLFAADLSKSQAATAASIRSMPTPGCRPTPSAASWPRAGAGSKIRCASKSSCARA